MPPLIRPKLRRVKPASPFALLGAAVFAIALLASGTRFGAAAAAATQPPTPPPLPPPATPAAGTDAAPPAAASTPIPIPSGFGLPGAGSSPPPGKATPSPPPDARKGIAGVWELQIQRGSKVDYAHFRIDQSGTTLTGSYLNDAGKRFPLAGSLDGQSVRLVVSMPDGTSLLLEGRLDGTTDMIGLLTTPQEQVPFTAAYRPKEKWIDNLNASPGGMGGLGGSGGGYSPP